MRIFIVTSYRRGGRRFSVKVAAKDQFQATQKVKSPGVLMSVVREVK